MLRKDIHVGMSVLATSPRCAAKHPNPMKVRFVGFIFVKTEDGNWWHPSDLSPAPKPQAVPTAEPKGTAPKWKTPGVHAITSYRSWRRYKAAGASFAVIPFNSTSRTPEKKPVAVSVNVARQRAIIGLSLVAIVVNTEN